MKFFLSPFQLPLILLLLIHVICSNSVTGTFHSWNVSADERNDPQARKLLHNFEQLSKHCHSHIGQWSSERTSKSIRNNSCLIAFSRAAEPEYEINVYRKLQQPMIILNTGEPLVDNCEYPILSNVGQEVFSYLHYILEHYHHPEYFAATNIFCRMNPQRYDSGYTSTKLYYDLQSLCAKNIHLKHGFSYLGKDSFEIKTAMSPDVNYEADFEQIFGHHRIAESIQKMKFVPGNCFAVSKAHIYKRSYKFYTRLKKMKDQSITLGIQKPLNEVGTTVIMKLVERLWAEIFGSKCQNETPWCCSMPCTVEKMEQETN